MLLRKENIKDRTEEYWKCKYGYDCYVEELLGRELQEARKTDPVQLSGLAEPVHALAMTVGDSFEPLLQAACVLKPQRMILILNRNYAGNRSGMNHGKELRRLVGKLGTAPDLPDEFRPALTDQQFDIIELPQSSGELWLRATNRHFDLIEIAQDTPTEVFQALMLAFRAAEAQPPAGHTNAVDITGAKKSMVVGAFLYAAHSQLPITYVDFDFDGYNTDFHRPYGYTCRIGKIADPYEAFRLRDWEQVRQLYRNYNFRGARELIVGTTRGNQKVTGILEAMSGHLGGATDGRTLYDPNAIQKVERLVEILKMYEAWDSGDFNTAADLADRLPTMELPSVIQHFGGKWFSITGATFSNIPSGFYGDEEGLKVYAHDELARIRRLVDCNEDNRSAFLRAAGLNEVLLTARLVHLVVDPSDRTTILAAVDARTPNASALIKALLNGAPFAVEGVGLPNAKLLHPIPLTVSMRRWWSGTRYFSGVDDWDAFLKLRNKLAHTFMSVSKELAEDAILFVQANFEDFIGGAPVKSLTTTVKTLDWSELCTLCGLNDFLPPKLRD